ncbi:unnamed protein product [Dicrocoelium dendriticum]|nr:unnamed protein product [Dicrocoelium dendriticum]
MCQQIQCCYTNAQGLNSKLPELRHRHNTINWDIIAVTETWLSNDMLDTEIEISDMSVIRNDRPSRGGGVALYYRNCLRCEAINERHLAVSDALFCRMQLNGRGGEPSKKTWDACLLAVVYRPPNSTADRDDILLNALHYAVSQKYSHCLIMGDFNVPSIVSATSSGPYFKSKILEFMDTAALYNHVHRPTRHRGSNKPSLLDLILTNEELMIETISYDPPLGNSDHSVLNFAYVCYANTTEIRHENRRTITNYSVLHSLATTVNWDLNLQSTADDAWNELKDKISCVTQAASKVIPLRVPRRTNTWIRSRTRKWISTRDEIWRQYALNHCDATWENYKIVRNYCTSLIRADKYEWQKNMVLKFTNNTKLLYRYVNSRRKVKTGIPPLKTDGGLTTTAVDAANALLLQFGTVTANAIEPLPNQHSPNVVGISTVTFTSAAVASKLRSLRENSAPGVDKIRPKVLKTLAPTIAAHLASFFQSLLNSQTLPSEWKSGIVTPIYKGGKRSDPANYRPITLLPVLSKVMESLVADEITRYFESLKLISHLQHGFRRKRSCLTNLLLARDSWTKAVDEGSPLDVIYLDFSKAFDRVNHLALLHKLRAYGIHGSLLTWLAAYLHDRTIKVRVADALSETLCISSGVPQGSVLGPLLFLVYINDLPDNIQSSMQIFADDAKIWRVIHSTSDCALLQNDLDRINKWADINHLPLNPAKCHLLSLRSNLVNTYLLGQYALRRVTTEKDLGIIVQESLGNSLQCSKAANVANMNLRLLRRAFGVFERRLVPMLVNSYIRPHVEYAVQAWCPWLKRDIHLLEQPQRRATKATRGLSGLNYEVRLSLIGMFSSEYRRLRGDLILAYRILTESDHPCKSLLTLASYKRSRGHNLKLIIQHSRLDCRKYFYSLRICSQWNDLPTHVVNAPNITAFKQLLDIHLSDKQHIVV